MGIRSKLFCFAILSAFCASLVLAQPSDNSSSDQNPRIFGVLPNYTTVPDSPEIEPLTFREKLILFTRQTYDPGTIGAAAAGAGLSQAQNGDPKYGQGAAAYGKRFGAAMLDLTTQNFFQGALLAGILHEDPRYFRRGPQYTFWNRLGYAVSRVVVTRTDAGANRFNYSGILGMSMGIGLSNAYYPDASVSGNEVASRFATSLTASAIYNLLPEFWPDVRQKLFRHKSNPKPPAQIPQKDAFVK